MASHCRSLSLLALALAAAPAALFAQSNTTSAITGLVRDPAGKPLAGAVIRVTSPSLIGGERTAITAANGVYRIPGLPPGKYRIVVEAKGLSPLTGTDVLELSRTSTFNWKFPGTDSATVEVVAAAAGDLDAAPVGLTQNYSTADLANLPVDRSMTAIMSLTPGVNTGYAWGGDSSENGWLMDGMNISDQSGGGQWLFANPDWFSEVQVGGIGAPAEYGNFNGAYSNALVKRGGNAFEGSFNLYYADSKWESMSTNTFPGLDRTVLPAKSYDAAINIGGPIIQDKLWFFVSAWARQTQTTPIGALASDKRSYQNFLGKFTWQATPNATLEMLLEYDSLPETNKDIDNTVQPIASHNQVAPDRLFSLIWTQTLNANMVVTAKTSGYSGNYENRPNNGNAVSLNAEGSLSTTTLDYFNNNQWYRNNYRSRIEGVATLDWFTTGLVAPGDSHAFRFGVEQAQASNEDTKTPTGGEQLYAAEGDTPGLLTPDVFDVGGGYAIKIRSNRSALYLQDTWIINDRFTLRPGVRFERYQAGGYAGPTVWDKKVAAPRFGGSYALTKDQSDVLKFHWGKYYAAFSSWFIDRSYQQWTPVTTEYFWSGNDFDPFKPSTYPAAVPDPTQVSSVTNNLSPVDPNTKQPYTVETTFAYEHKFPGPWSATATWVYRQQKDILVRKDVADQTSGANATGSWVTSPWYYQGDVTNPAQNVTWWNTTVDPSNVSGSNFLVTTEPTAKRNYVAGSLVIERKWLDDWSLNASFTRARRYGNVGESDGYDSAAVYENPNAAINSYGLLPGYNDYEGKVHGAVKLPWIMKLAVNFTYLSGQRWTPYIRTPENNFNQHQYVNAEILGTEKYPSEHLLDLRLSKDFRFTSRSDLEVFTQVFNVLNTGTVLSYATQRLNSASYGTPSSVEQGRRLQVGLRYAF